jgi:hypothetical protein
MDRTKVALLISGYLDGELSSEEAAELAGRLAADERSLDRLVSSSFIHSQLLDWMDQPHARDFVAAAAISVPGSKGRTMLEWTATGQAGSVDAFATEFVQPAGAARWRSRAHAWSAVAAAILVAASLLITAYVVQSRPTFVGQLTDSTDSRWGNQGEIPVGTLLESGQELNLVSGSAVITFASGAKLLMEAPSHVRLESPLQVELLDGRIAAKVPRQAVNFTVTSTLARFIDLGTSFTLNLVAEKSFDLHVFEGLVEVRLDERFGEAARRPTRVAQVRALTFDVSKGDVANLHFEEGKKPPF